MLDSALLEAAFRGNRSLCSITDSDDGKVLDVNDAWLDAFGYSKEEVVGKTTFEIGIWSSLDKRNAMLSKLLTDGCLDDFEVELKSKSGEERILDVTGEILNFDDKNYVLLFSNDITEKRKLEEEQKFTQELFAESFRVNTSLCAITDPKTRVIQDVNDAWLKVLGYSRDEIVGKTSQNFNLWGSDENREKVFKELNDKGELKNFEGITYSKSGEPKAILMSAVILKIGARELLFFVGQDIDAQRKWEKKQEENLDLFAASFRLNIGLCTISDPVTGEYLDANDVWLETLGYTREEVIGKTSVELNIWGDPENRKKAMDKLRDEGSLKGYDAIIYTKFGEKRMTKTNAEIMRIGGFDRLFFSLIDLTDEQRNADELKASEARFRDIAEYSSDWFWEVDEEFKFTYISEGGNFFQVTERDEMLGKLAINYFLGLGSVSGNEPIQKAMKARAPFRNERTELHLNSGGISYHQYSGKPVFDEFGEFAGYRGTGSDVTKEVFAEQQRISVEERLQQAQKMEAVGQLTGGVAHDFNNLLAIVIGNAELLEEKDPENSQLDAIMRAATRGAELTRSLLAFSRKQLLEPKAFWLDEQLEPMLQILPRTLGEIITIRTHSDTELWQCYADPGQVENVLLNLAINARDAMPNGGILEICYLNETTQDGDFVCLTVKDTGVGMSAEILEHIMEPFFTTKEVGSGSGLGLSMAYGFADQSDGMLDISSQLGEGTTVKLMLPRASDRNAQ